MLATALTDIRPVSGRREFRRFIDHRRAEFSWVLEDNHDINDTAEMAGARHYKTYRIYEKAL